jgi:PTH1 family peptidyl-tRNA hydrolase
MLLFVGLGNPGSQYERNRHNVGFMALDEITRRHSFSAFRRRFHGRVAEGSVAGRRTLALKPDTYMNRSGQAVQAAKTFYKIPAQDIIVFQDEIDLASGKMKIKRGGGSAGHNGLRSIDAHIGSDYRRVRIGVGHPGDKDVVKHHVLNDFGKADDRWLIPLLEAIAEATPFLALDDDPGFSNKVALLLQLASSPPKEDQSRGGEPKPSS